MLETELKFQSVKIIDLRGEPNAVVFLNEFNPPLYLNIYHYTYNKSSFHPSSKKCPLAVYKYHHEIPQLVKMQRTNECMVPILM